jgi:hypothetical protein
MKAKGNEQSQAFGTWQMVQDRKKSLAANMVTRAQCEHTDKEFSTNGFPWPIQKAVDHVQNQLSEISPKLF